MRAFLFAGLALIPLILLFGCAQTNKTDSWDYKGKVFLGKGTQILEDFNGKSVAITYVSGQEKPIEGTVIRVRGDDKKEWRECEEFSQCITGWFEYFEVSEFEVFEWDDVEQQCNSMNKFENWTKNCSDDARCVICPDTIMTSSVWCHAREYCEEIDARAGSDFVK